MPFNRPADIVSHAVDPETKDLFLDQMTTRSGITALAGGGQAGTTHILTERFNRVTTVASAADSVKLPPAVPGIDMFVCNSAATNSMNVFPATGEYINALGQNAAFAVAANKAVHLFCTTPGIWNAITTA
jgi:hypothetical protein